MTMKTLLLVEEQVIDRITLFYCVFLNVGLLYFKPFNEIPDRKKEDVIYPRNCCSMRDPPTSVSLITH